MQKEKLLNHLDILISDAKDQKASVSSAQARCKYNTVINYLQNLFKDVDEGKFD